MKTTFIGLLTVALLAASCKTSDIKISNDLYNQSSPLQVKGNGGMLINQKISFGGFYTTPVKRGISSRTEYSLFGISREKAYQPVEFTLFAPGSLSADIVGSNNYNNNIFDLFKGIEKYADNFTNGFFGVIIPNDKKSPVWQVLIENDNSGMALKSETDDGVAVDENGNQIDIYGTKTLSNNNFLTNDTRTFGFELLRNGKSIGAVSVIGNGKVWIDKNLTPEDQLTVASLATILITKQNLGKD